MLLGELGAYWGTNNTDHQARICHSTTMTGMANTWGYGAMTTLDVMGISLAEQLLDPREGDALFMLAYAARL